MFDYPTDWTVTEEKGDPSVTNAVHGTVANASGSRVLSYDVGVDGLGGTCIPEDAGTAKVIATYETAIKGDYLNAAAPDVQDSHVNAFQLVKKDVDGTYTSEMGLSSDKAVMSIHEVSACDVSVPAFVAKNIDIGNGQHGSNMFTTNTSDSGESTTYTTEADATATLNTSDGKAVFALLRSVRYQ